MRYRAGMASRTDTRYRFPEPTHRITLNMPEPLHEWIEKKAQEQTRSKSATIVRMLEALRKMEEDG